VQQAGGGAAVVGLEDGVAQSLEGAAHHALGLGEAAARLETDVVGQAGGERVPRARLAVRHAPGYQHHRPERVLGPGDGFTRQSALAHAALALDGGEERAVMGDGEPRAVEQEGQLGVAPDERGLHLATPAAGRRQRLDGAPRLDGLLPVPHPHEPDRFVAHDVAGRGVGGRSDEHRAGEGCRL
jgi:hypothetical protein